MQAICKFADLRSRSKISFTAGDEPLAACRRRARRGGCRRLGRQTNRITDRKTPSRSSRAAAGRRGLGSPAAAGGSVALDGATLNLPLTEETTEPLAAAAAAAFILSQRRRGPPLRS